MDPTYLPHFSYSPPATADSLRGRPMIARRTFLAGTGAMLLATPLAEYRSAERSFEVGARHQPKDRQSHWLTIPPSLLGRADEVLQ